jgi:ribosome-binding ATPase YchF (GTP1/OBG family)
MKTVGIVGSPGTTAPVFTALTAMIGAPGSSNQAVIDVPDERVEVLAELHSSRKRVYTQLRFVDVGGLVRRGARAGAGALSAELLGHLRTTDALMIVADATGGDAEAGAGELALELIYADLEPLKAKLERDRKGGREQARTLEHLARAIELLESGTALRDETWEADALELFRGMGLLTLKPQIVVADVGDDPTTAVPEGMLGVASTLETEVAGMEPDEAAELLASYGAKERALPTVIATIYRALELITFLTAGETESRAWEVRRGASAPEAAGVIHSDFQRGFIRAEVVAYDQLIAAGSWNAARAAGKVRQEGKTYVVQEGDVVEFRFAV